MQNNKVWLSTKHQKVHLNSLTTISPELVTQGNQQTLMWAVTCRNQITPTNHITIQKEACIYSCARGQQANITAQTWRELFMLQSHTVMSTSLSESNSKNKWNHLNKRKYSLNHRFPLEISYNILCSALLHCVKHCAVGSFRIRLMVLQTKDH